MPHYFLLTDFAKYIGIHELQDVNLDRWNYWVL
jgi:hypothetical protein